MIVNGPDLRTPVLDTSSLVPGSSFGCSSLHINNASQHKCWVAVYSLKKTACKQVCLHVDCVLACASPWMHAWRYDLCEVAHHLAWWPPLLAAARWSAEVPVDIYRCINMLNCYTNFLASRGKQTGAMSMTIKRNKSYATYSIGGL